MNIMPCRKVSMIVAVVLFLPLIASAYDFSADSENGLRFESRNGQFKAKLGGRLQLDGAVFNEDKSQLANDWIVRRARISFRLDVLEDWRVSLQYDLADESERYASLWLRYRGFNNIDITVGQFQEPFGLEGATSSNNIVFMERSLVNALVPGTNVGLGWRHWGGYWSINSGIFWETYIEDSDPFASKEGYGISGRLSVAPIDEANRVLHLGLSGAYRVPDESERVRFRTQPESDVADVRFISTGRMREVEDYFIAGIEAAMMRGPLMLQGEYIQTMVHRSGGRDDEHFDGGYLLASFLLGDERRRYSSRSGNFGSVNPTTTSVWELAVRRSYLDLNSSIGSITGGRQQNMNWGINWYPNANLRVMFNYTQVDTNEEAGDDDPDIFQLRLQWAI